MPNLKYKRVLLKLSGEALAGESKHGIDAKTIGGICDKIKEVVEMVFDSTLEVSLEGEENMAQKWKEQHLIIWECLQLV